MTVQAYIAVGTAASQSHVIHLLARASEATAPEDGAEARQASPRAHAEGVADAFYHVGQFLRIYFIF